MGVRRVSSGSATILLLQTTYHKNMRETYPDFSRIRSAADMQSTRLLCTVDTASLSLLHAPSESKKGIRALHNFSQNSGNPSSIQSTASRMWGKEGSSWLKIR